MMRPLIVKPKPQLDILLELGHIAEKSIRICLTPQIGRCEN